MRTRGWEKVKKKGNSMYKGKIQPIDIMKEGGILWDFAVGSIIKYAYRNRRDLSISFPNRAKEDLDKIIHYAEMLIEVLNEENRPSKV